MTQQSPVKSILTGSERLLLAAIRNWSRSGGAGDGPGPAPEPVCAAAAAFLALMRDTDPFVVRIRGGNDHRLTLFELQLIYAVSEWRTENQRTAYEVLEWWFPEVLIAEGRARLSRIAEAMDSLGLEARSGEGLRGYFLNRNTGLFGAQPADASVVTLGAPGVPWPGGRRLRLLH